MKLRLSEQIDMLMKRKKIRSLRSLSALCGIPASSLAHMRHGRLPRNLSALAKLAACLDVSLYYLLWGVEDPHSRATENLYKEILSGDFHVEMKVKKKIGN